MLCLSVRLYFPPLAKDRNLYSTKQKHLFCEMEITMLQDSKVCFAG
ncbi:hypothetical protein PI172_0237 [Prevotella intermedia]|uniref:Uncharacterized protein n=1 Tax=Prevotella intermedia TaxID=28131 RepID=A0AAD1BIF6_PREIN|nr:hypothetical protein PI172_0237 [Prevotella intermedia]